MQPRVKLLILLALLGFAVSGCAENGHPPETTGALVFPEIEEMVLVAPDNAIQGNFSDPEAIFFIDRFEVTNAQYAEFLDRSGYVPHDPEAFLASWTGGTVERGMEDLPVIFVSFHDAVRYAAHASKSLPDFGQWLRAAMGNAYSKNFPWGRDFDLFYCNSLRAQIDAPARVGTFENGKTEWGCYDMIGNVAEWTRTRVPDYVYPSYYVMGGSWNDGGSAKEEMFDFSLVPEYRKQAEDLSLFPHQLPGNRNNTLGFRCVRNDAVTFIRDQLTSRIAALSPDRRPKAFDELALMSEPLYSVLKLLEFETLSRNISAPPSTAMVRLVSPPDARALPGLLLCYNNGFMGMYALGGTTKWQHVEEKEEEEQETAFGYTVVEAPARIIMQSKWEAESQLKVVDPTDGSELWDLRGPGEAWHIEPVSGDLLVDWHIDNRLKSQLDFPFDLRQWIDFHAAALLTREALFLHFRLFAAEREVKEILLKSLHQYPFDLRQWIDSQAAFLLTREALFLHLRLFAVKQEVENSLFEVSRFNGLPYDWAEILKQRFRIQLVDGEHNNTEVRPVPGSILSLHDIDTGKVKWAQDLPGALFGFEGYEELGPLVFANGGKAAVALRDTRIDRISIAQLSMGDGSVEHRYDLADLGKELTSWAALRDASFMGIMDAEKLLFFDMDRKSVETRTVMDLLSEVEQVVAVDREGTTRIVDRRSELLDGPRWTLSDLFRLGPSLDPWLLARSERRDRCLIFCGLKDTGFAKVFLVEGTFNRYRHLAGGDRRHVLVWDSVGDLICFDGSGHELLWKTNVGYITDTEIAFSDLDGNGTHEAMIATLSGEILVIELDTGATTHYFRRTGSTFSYLFPVGAEGGRRQEIFCWIKDQGIFILDTDHAPATDGERNLLLTVEEMERWRTGKNDR